MRRIGNFQVGGFEPEKMNYLEGVLVATQSKLQLKRKKKVGRKKTLLHIFETSAKEDGITLKNGNKDIKYDKVFIKDLRDNLEEARKGNQQADINLQTVFGKVASEYKFLLEPEERHKYHEELIDWLEGVDIV